MSEPMAEVAGELMAESGAVAEPTVADPTGVPLSAEGLGFRV